MSPSSRDMNFDSMVEPAIEVCLDDFHEVAPLPKVSTYPLVELTLSLSLTQFASY